MVLLAACSGAPSTQVSFVIDQGPGLEVASLRIVVANTSELPERIVTDAFYELDEGNSLPISHPLVPSGGDPSRTYRASFLAYDRAGELLGQQTFHGTYRPGEVVEVPVVFSAECVASICDAAGLRCELGSCVESAPTPDTAPADETQVRFDVFVPPELAIDAVELETIGSASPNLRATLDEGVPLTVVARPARDEPGLFTTRVSYYAGSSLVARESLRWSFVPGERRTIRLEPSTACLGFTCDDLGYRCIEGICVEQCVEGSLSDPMRPEAIPCESFASDDALCVAGEHVARRIDGLLQFDPEASCILGCEGIPRCAELLPASVGLSLPAADTAPELAVLAGDERTLPSDDCEPRETSFGRVMACELDSLWIEAGGRLLIEESSVPVVLLVRQSVRIEGEVNVAGTLPGESSPRDGQSSGDGGGGGSRGGNGGGRDENVELDLPPERWLFIDGGMGGAGIRSGGLAGGRIQISAGVGIHIDGDGSILASGKNGGPDGDVGSGGGAGGVVVLDAPEVTMRVGDCPGDCVISVRGGDGGGPDGGLGARQLDGAAGENQSGGGGGVGLVRIVTLDPNRRDYEPGVMGVWGTTIALSDIEVGVPR